MNIKSLLLGSAAALVAVSGARAADAVMAPEPEPVEYVRVCDAYGAGFFYIPGTETCLQISGHVYFQVGAGSYAPNVQGTATADSVFGYDRTGSYHYQRTGQNGWRQMIRARVNFDARSETELGTLRSYIRLQANWNSLDAPTNDGATGVDQAFIQLGGLTMGYTESLWVAEGGGRAGPLSIAGWQDQHGAGYYGYQQRFLVSYSFSSGGFHGAISLEDDGLTGNGYMPDVVAAVGYGGSWGAVWAKLGYDESFQNNAFNGVVTFPPFALDTNRGGFGAQIGAQINMPNMPGSALRVVGYWADGDHRFNVGAPSTGVGGFFGLGTPNAHAVAPTTFGGANWSVLASYQQAFSETFSATVGFQWFNDLYYAGTDFNSGVDAWAGIVSARWVPVRDFAITAELAYTDIGSIRGPAVLGASGNPAGNWSGQLRFTRSF